jgi:ribosomal protein L7/L12
MSANLLTIPEINAISTEEKTEIDQAIQAVINQHRDNGLFITKLTLDSVTSLTASDSRSRELESQGFYKRLVNNLTGKNKKLRDQIARDQIKVQYASTQAIQKLAEQNLLTFELVTAVNNKLNTLVVDLNSEINKIYTVLVHFFRETRSEVVDLQNRVQHLERNVSLLTWVNSIEYLMFDGTEYAELDDMDKVACITNDFYLKTDGIWHFDDLLLLKSTLNEIGLNPKSMIEPAEFYRRLIEKPSLIDKLFKDLPLDGLAENSYCAPLLMGVERIQKLNGSDQYMFQAVTAHLDSLGVPYNIRELQLSSIHYYLLNSADMRTDVKVNIYDFVLELLLNLKVIAYGMEAEVIHTDSEELQSFNRQAESGDYDVVLMGCGKNKINLCKKVSEFLEIDLKSAKRMVDQCPNIVLESVSKERANEFRELLSKNGAFVTTKTNIESFEVITAPFDGIMVDPRKSNTNNGASLKKGDFIAAIVPGSYDRGNIGGLISTAIRMGEKVNIVAKSDGRLFFYEQQLRNTYRKGEAILVVIYE